MKISLVNNPECPYKLIMKYIDLSLKKSLKLLIQTEANRKLTSYFLDKSINCNDNQSGHC